MSLDLNLHPLYLKVVRERDEARSCLVEIIWSFPNNHIQVEAPELWNKYRVAAGLEPLAVKKKEIIHDESEDNQLQPG